jgi:hypothetical protein
MEKPAAKINSIETCVERHFLLEIVIDILLVQRLSRCADNRAMAGFKVILQATFRIPSFSAVQGLIQAVVVSHRTFAPEAEPLLYACSAAATQNRR